MQEPEDKLLIVPKSGNTSQGMGWEGSLHHHLEIDLKRRRREKEGVLGSKGAIKAVAGVCRAPPEWKSRAILVHSK